jgi:hypothetical protein
MRRVITTVVDLNTAIMGKLTKADGTLDNLVFTTGKLEGRILEMERTWLV